jgi:transcriptional regulator with XRE-family HTH domain
MGLRLQRLRRERGLTQEALARRARVPVRSLQQWEQGIRTPLLTGAARVAAALGVTIDELAGQRPPGSPGGRRRDH